jgi:hypothetical protein
MFTKDVCVGWTQRTREMDERPKLLLDANNGGSVSINKLCRPPKYSTHFAMRLPIPATLLLAQGALGGIFYYGGGCAGDHVEFSFNGNECKHLNSGFAKSLLWYDPGNPSVAVAYKPDADHDYCGKSVCSINGLAGDVCCDSNNKNIKGAELHRMGGRFRKRGQGPCKNVWEEGATLNIDVGGGMYVRVPNVNSTEPSAIDIQEALVAAGIQGEEMDVLVERAVGNVGV